MMHTKLVRAIAGVLLLQSAMSMSSEGLRRRELGCNGVSNDERDCVEVEDKQVGRQVPVGITGDRVDAIDRTGAECIASMTSAPNDPIEITTVVYYFKATGVAPFDNPLIQELDALIFFTISSAILWCTTPREPEVIVEGGDGPVRKLADILESPSFLRFKENQRSLEEARRLGILSISNPRDRIVDPAEFDETRAGETNDPCGDEEGECVTIQGKMNVVAHRSDGVHLAVASVLDAVQKAMDDDLLVDDFNADCTEGGLLCSIEKVTWLGVTLDEVKGIGGGDNPDEIGRGDIPNPSEDDNNDVPIVLYAAIPMALLLFFALLLAKNKRQRDVKTPAQLLAIDEDHVIVGTGDPPRCFHEGMYHYTRSGARYLSTNCQSCADTRRMGLFTDADLPTISEGRLYDPESHSDGDFSFEDVSVGSEEDDPFATHVELHDSSHRRKRMLVPACSKNLGRKGSFVDVHQCTSATCRICTYRPSDVAFVASPVTSPSTKMFSSQQNGLGDTCLV